MKKLFLMATLCATFCFVFECGAEIVSGDKCGDDCTWTFDTDTGKLTISGTGAMYDAGYEQRDTAFGRTDWHTNVPWYDYAQSIQTVDIQQGITSIGVHVFWDTPMTSVSIPDTVTSIAYGAFQYSGLSSVDIPSSVTSIGGAAFYQAPLGNVTIADSVTYIGDDAFGGNRDLQEVFVPASVTYLGGNFYSEGWDRPDTTVYCPDTDVCSSSSGNVIPYHKEADGVYKIGNNYYASPDAVIENRTCNNTNGECQAQVAQYKSDKAASMAGGALCETQADCLSLINLSDTSPYCHSINDCKRLTDMVDSGVCQDVGNCKELSDMAASGEYCTTVAECKALNDMVGGENCDSLESCKTLSDMVASGEYCSTVAECKRFMDLMNSGYCEGFAVCKEMFNASVINYDGKRYGSLEDLYNGNALPSITRQEQGDGSFAVYKDGVFAGYKGKRIYTMEEANRVTKPMGNTLKIKYR